MEGGENGIMTKEDIKKKREEVVEAYEEMFGGYPAFLFMGASDEVVIKALEPCLKSGKEYEPDEGIY